MFYIEHTFFFVLYNEEMHGQVTAKEPFPCRACRFGGRAPAPFRAPGQLFGLTKGNLQTGGKRWCYLSCYVYVGLLPPASKPTHACRRGDSCGRHEGSKPGAMCSATKPRLLRATGSCSWAAQRASNRRNERRQGPTGQQYTIPI